MRAVGKRPWNQPKLRLERLEPRCLLAGHPIISEFMAANDSTLIDGDGQYADWVEIFNASDQSLDLAGYRLTDKADEPSRWVFPSVALGSGEFLFVFASGSDSDNYLDPAGNLHANFALKAEGEYLALLSPDGKILSQFGSPTEPYPEQREDVSFGIPQAAVLLDGSSRSTYQVPMSDAVDAVWYRLDFDPRSHGFESGTAAIGLENRPDDRVNFVGQIQSQLSSRAHSVYARLEFNLDDAESVRQLTLRLKYDNGFVAYLNGVEVARDNAPDRPNWFAVAPTSTRSDAQVLEFVDFDVSAHTDQLVDGKNVLAIHGMNAWQDDSDLLIVPELVASMSILDRLPEPGYMTKPTPGSTNPSDIEVFDGFVFDVQVSRERGIYDKPIDVVFSTATGGADIRYTTDGSPPTATHGTLFTGPMTIDRTTTLRSVAVKPGSIPTRVSTETYLFLDDVVLQDHNPPEGYPDRWGAGVTDWGLDQDPDDIRRIAGDSDYTLPQARQTIKDSLLSLPTLSLVMDKDDIFGRERGIYTHPQQGGTDWERAVSVELIDGEDTALNFQADAGVRIQGFTSRDPSRNPKHSLRLVFRREYGDTKLRVPFFGADGASEFDTLVLRSNSQDAWVYNTADNRRGQFVRDQWARETQLAMGQPSPRGNWVHLYINGLYWGLYNPTERPDASFNAAYFGSDKKDYDTLKNHEEVIDGNGAAYQQLLGLIQNDPRRFNAGYRDLSEDAAYQRVLGNNPDGTPNPEFPRYVDAVNLIDYVIHNVYAAAQDWPGNNYIGRSRLPDSDGFQFFDWDNEHGMKSGVSTNRTLPHSRDADSPTKIHHAFGANAEYRLLFADRLHRAFFNGGPLWVDPENPEWDAEHPDRNVPAARWMRLTGQIEMALIAEAARWGDVRGIQYTPHDQFQDVRDRLLTTWFPRRSQIVLDQFRQQGWYPDVVAPSFSPHGGLVAASTDVEITAPAGQVYYTTDGSDPRLMGGAVSPRAEAYTGAVRSQGATTLKARALRDGQWSALNEADFAIPSDLSLRITEINYHPHPANPVVGMGELNVDENRYEFIELNNTGDRAIDLTGVRLYEQPMDRSALVSVFQFNSQSIEAGERIVVVRDRDAFESRYGRSIRIASGDGGPGGRDGEFRGALSNTGQQLVLADSAGDVVQVARYGASAPWPKRANGLGSSLELVEVHETATAAEDWRASFEFGGSPGQSRTTGDARIVIREILPNPEPGMKDRVELQNVTSSPLDISRWYLSRSGVERLQHQIPDQTVVPAGGYQLLSMSEIGLDLDGVRGDELWIIESNPLGEPVRFVDHVQFGPTLPGLTLGPWHGGSEVFVALAVPTLGAANSGVRKSEVVFSEIHNNPVDPDGPDRLRAEGFQFVELYNRTGSPIELTNWKLSGSVEFDFPHETVIPPQQTLLVVPFGSSDVSHDVVFRFQFGLRSSDTLIGPFDGLLPTDAGVVRLERLLDPATVGGEAEYFAVVDSVPYQDRAPWPVGGVIGQSLARVPVSGFGLAPQSWRLETPSPHSVAELSNVIGDSNADGVFDRLDIIQVLQRTQYETDQPATDSEGDWNRDGVFDRFDVIFALQADFFLRGR